MSFVVIVAALFTPLAVQASVTSPSPVDTSNAIRWDADGSPIGDIVYEFITKSNEAKNIEAPFPLNFDGTRFPALCMSTNGVVYPLASVATSCSSNSSSEVRTRNDINLELVALNARAPVIAALAIDLIGSYEPEIHNPQRETPEELQIAGVNVAGNVITVTTTEAHGFRIGELIQTSLNLSFTGSNFGNRSIQTVPSTTTFTVENTSSIADGTYAPVAGHRAVVFRRVVFEQVNGLSLSGTTLTVTTHDGADFGIGGKFTFNGTGIPALDDGKFVVASRVDNNNFTVTVPASVTDVDSTTAGDQSTRSFSSNKPWALERDEVGAIQQVYFGTTTVEGRDAYSLTWYRTRTHDFSTNGINGGRFPAVNPQTTTITVQLLIVKRSTGSDAAGWDFDYEVNFGHATDASDGYRSTDPVNSCQVDSLEFLALCRWGVGTARFEPGPQISSFSHDGTLLTINTATPHGLTVGRYVRPFGLCRNSACFNDIRKIASVVDADTITINIWSNQFAEEAAPAAAKLGYSESSELFPNNSVLDLRDAGGSTALVRNSLNSNVLGRYTFGMVNGQLTGFLVPTMGAGVSGTPPADPAAASTPAAEAPTTTATAAVAPAAVAPTTTAPAAEAPTTTATAATQQRVSTKRLPTTGDDVNIFWLMSIALTLAGGLLLRRTRQI
jgi:LPXTG-motif cell wall-anchored protein